MCTHTSKGTDVFVDPVNHGEGIEKTDVMVPRIDSRGRWESEDVEATKIGW